MIHPLSHRLTALLGMRMMRIMSIVLPSTRRVSSICVAPEIEPEREQPQCDNNKYHNYKLIMANNGTWVDRARTVDHCDGGRSTYYRLQYSLR